MQPNKIEAFCEDKKQRVTTFGGVQRHLQASHSDPLVLTPYPLPGCVMLVPPLFHYRQACNCADVSADFIKLSVHVSEGGGRDEQPLHQLGSRRTSGAAGKQKTFL